MILLLIPAIMGYSSLNWKVVVAVMYVCDGCHGEVEPLFKAFLYYAFELMIALWNFHESGWKDEIIVDKQ